ncbi:MAG: hypothetical protein SOY30_01435 [Eubacteriales bacterium]|nr:hypothetical protein [Eubacteriales bacterium]
MMKQRLLSLLLILTMTLTPAALAEQPGPALVDGGLELADSSVRYPQLTGMADEALQQQLNDRILTAGDIENRLTRLALLMQSPVSMQVAYQAALSGDVLSCVFSALGAVTDERPTHVWSALNVDLTDGSDITFNQLFTDEEALRRDLEEYLDYGVGPELSAHLRNSELTPVPEVFGLTETGLTLYYPMERLSTLSDRAGAVTILWYELREHLRLEDGDILPRIGARDMLVPTPDSGEKIRTAVEAGTLPGVPVTLGGSVQEATDTYRMLTDPDLYQDGRMFALEDAAFRQVWLLTDALTEKTWDKSVIKGLRADRFNLWGLYPGLDRQAVEAMLGQPDTVLTLDADMADAYRLVPGESLYYNYTGVQLRLHFDAEGLLTSLIITQAA